MGLGLPGDGDYIGFSCPAVCINIDLPLWPTPFFIETLGELVTVHIGCRFSMPGESIDTFISRNPHPIDFSAAGSCICIGCRFSRPGESIDTQPNSQYIEKGPNGPLIKQASL